MEGVLTFYLAGPGLGPVTAHRVDMVPVNGLQTKDLLRTVG